MIILYADSTFLLSLFTIGNESNGNISIKVSLLQKKYEWKIESSSNQPSKNLIKVYESWYYVSLNYSEA